MTSFNILIEGYAYEGDNGDYFASPTTLYLESSGIKIIADPGTSRKKLTSSLKKEKISIGELNYVFLSHYHPDHFLNLSMFPNIPVIDGTTIWDGDKETPNTTGKIPNTDIEILPLPGHTQENCALVFESKEFGRTIFCPDIFWWEDEKQKVDDYQELVNRIDPFAVSMKDLISSRKKVLEIADYIIPGHGKVFVNPFHN